MGETQKETRFLAARPPPLRPFLSGLFRSRVAPQRGTRTTWGVGKRRSAPFYFKTIILPRQARDKRRENSKREMRFLAAMRFAQSLNAGVLPTKELPNTFVAQAFDAGA